MKERATLKAFHLIAGLVALSCLPGASLARAQPKASIPQSTVDLGEVSKGDVVFHEFEIRNEGDADLFIESARSTCGCTVTDFDRSVAPGASGLVRAKLDTRTLSGPVTTEIRVETSDPQRQNLILKITATVRSYLGALPGYARWNTVETETEGTIGITVWPVDKEPFEVTGVSVTYPAITARIRLATAEERYSGHDGQQWRVELTLGPEPPIGTISGYAEIQTTHPRQARVHIPVSGFVRPLIFVSPDRADLGSFALGSEVRRARYEVRNFGTLPMTIEGVEIGIPGVGTSIETLEEGYIYQVAALFDPETVPAGDFAGEVVVRTNLERRPVITWAIKGTVLPSERGESEDASSE